MRLVSLTILASLIAGCPASYKDPGTDPVDDTDTDSDSTTDDTDTVVEPPTEDRDLDGVPNDEDCAPDDPRTYPGAWEACDGVDNDCAEGGSEAGTVTLFPYRGRAVDLTEVFAPGQPGAVVRYELDRAGELRFCDGLFHARIEITDVLAEVTSQNGYEATEIAADDDGPVISAEEEVELSVRGLTISGGLGTKGGGVSLLGGGSLVIRDSVLTSNTSTGHGGAVYMVGGTRLEVTQTLVEGNTASDAGGGVYACGAELDVMFDGLVVMNNEASGAGGGLQIGAPMWTMTATTLSENFAASVGGGAAFVGRCEALEAATIELDETMGSMDAASVVAGNRGSTGGGLYVDGGDVTIEGGVSGNSAAQGGGGLRVVNGARLEMTGDLTDNAAAEGGAAASIVASDLVLDGGSVSNNTSEAGAGAVDAGTQSTITAAGVTFTGNAGDSGGAIGANGATLSLSGCTFERNDALTSDGGAIRVNGVGLPGGAVMLNMDSTVFRENNAAALGGAVCAVSGQVYVDGGAFEDGNAFRGGCFYLGSAGATWSGGTTMTRCAAAERGGAMSITGQATVNVNGLTLTDSSAELGGLLHSELATVNITSGVFTGGSAEDGGGVYLAGGNLTLAACDVSANVAASAGGGVFVASGALTLSAGEVHDNMASQAGGLAVDGGSAQINAVMFEGNLPEDIVSGIAYSFGGSVTRTCTIAGCN
jgi:hypothetical protein